jgi:hypothetical protein
MADVNGEQNADGTSKAAAEGTPAPSDNGGVADGKGTQTPKVFTFKEDRTDWVPRHRITETGQKLTAAEQRALKAEQDLATERARVQALVGATPKDDQTKQTDEIRELLQGMFPQLKELEKLTAGQLQKVLDAASGAEATTQAHWNRVAAEMLSTLDEQFADEIGVEKLTDSQQRRIRNAYRAEAEAAVEARKQGADPTGDFLDRHERGDKTLVAEFLKGYLGDFFEPAKRAVTSAAVRRQRPTPNGERTRMTVTKAPEIDYNNEDAFKKALTEARASAGS